MSGADRKVGRPRRDLSPDERAAKAARRRELAKLRGRACRARRKHDKLVDLIDGMVPDWDADNPAKVLAEMLRRMRLDLK
ncbi:hypothetical protein [Mesorhizobium sp. WSM4313]|uniref:hypothetical protein n=1 Tax=Mesorhizobium sp. WSM4313 TaxID=2029412 RepID=UPI001140BDD2|nr:hypothetical protein [Mesorhizobium sp. WSM4313]